MEEGYKLRLPIKVANTGIYGGKKCFADRAFIQLIMDVRHNHMGGYNPLHVITNLQFGKRIRYTVLVKSQELFIGQIRILAFVEGFEVIRESRNV